MLINAQQNALEAYNKLDLDINGDSDIVLNHWQTPIIEGRKLTLGGRKTTRMERLEIANQLGVPTMKWRTPDKIQELDGDLILKREGSLDGKGVKEYKQGDVINEGDIVCEFVSDDQTLYKIETLRGEFVIAWYSPVSKLVRNINAYERFVWDIPKQVISDFKPLMDYFKENNFGYVAIDLMKDNEGNFKLIEFNDNFVAITWSSQFELWKTKMEQIINNML